MALGGATAALGIAARLLGDGQIPDTDLVLLMAGVAGWIGAIVADRYRGPLTTIAVLGAAQAVLHTTMTLLPGTAHDSGPTLSLGTGAAGLIAAHALMASVLGFTLAQADVAMGAVLGRVHRVCTSVAGPRPAHAPLWAPTAPQHAADRARTVLLRRTRARRGPPAIA